MIVFRVDANEQVATGHLMRTLSIASACRKCGLMCEFWLAEEKETERIAKAGFPYRILGTRWDALEDELPVMKQRLQATAGGLAGSGFLLCDGALSGRIKPDSAGILC